MQDDSTSLYYIINDIWAKNGVLWAIIPHGLDFFVRIDRLEAMVVCSKYTGGGSETYTVAVSSFCSLGNPLNVQGSASSAHTLLAWKLPPMLKDQTIVVQMVYRHMA